MFVPISVPVSTGICDDPTPSTPGTALSRSLNWSTRATVLASSYPLNCGEIENVIRFSVLNPRFCFLKFHNDRENSAPPVSNSRVNATCPATRYLRNRTWPGPADVVEPWSFIICETPVRVARHAGIRPNSSAETTVAAAANPITLPSNRAAMPCIPASETTAWVKMFIIQLPKTSPRTPPAHKGSFPPAVAASSAPARLPGPNGSQTRAAVRRPSPAADSPRWCTQSAKPAPPSQTAPSALSRNPAVLPFSPVTRQPEVSSWLKIPFRLFHPCAI